LKILRLAEHVLPVIPAIDDMIDEAVVDRSQRAWHRHSLPRLARSVKKIVLTGSVENSRLIAKHSYRQHP
jgi:hypothetical protein